MKSKYYITFLLKVIPVSIIATTAIILAIPYLLLTQDFNNVMAQHIKDLKSIKYSYYLKHFKDRK